MEISEILKDIKPLKKTSQRAELIKEIYAVYTSDDQRIFRKKANWKRYCEWCKENKTGNSLEAQKKFSKSKHFIKEHNIKTFCVFLAPMKTPDLFYIASVAKDMANRKQNFSGFIISNMLNRECKL